MRATCQLLCNRLNSLGGVPGTTKKCKGLADGALGETRSISDSRCALCDGGRSLTLSGPGFFHLYEKLRGSGKLVVVGLSPGRSCCGKGPVLLECAWNSSSHAP